MVANDIDQNGDDLKIHSFTQPPNGYGTVTKASDKQLEFFPGPTFLNGGPTTPARFYYTVEDGHGGISEITNAPEFRGHVSVFHPPSGDPGPPDAVDDNALTKRNTPVDIDVLANDMPGKPALKIESHTQGAHGTVTPSDHGTLIYRPDSSFGPGLDSFTYQVVNNRGEVDPDGGGTVTVSVSGHTAIQSSLNTANELYDFDMVDWNSDFKQDLVVIKKTGTASGKTEVDILSGADDFQSVLLHSATNFLVTNADWTFKIAAWNPDGFFDLVGIWKNNTNTPNNKVEVHVASGADGFQSSLGGVATALPESDQNTEYEIVDWDLNGSPDIIAIQRNGPSGHTELDVVNGSLGWTTFFPGFHDYATGFLTTDQTWDFEVLDWNANGQYELVGIKQQQTGTGSTELHVLNGATSFQSFLEQLATELPPTGETFAFKVLDFNPIAPKDLIGIERVAGGKITVHVPVQPTLPITAAAYLYLASPTDFQNPPTASNDIVVVPTDGQALIAVLANDSDSDGDPLTVTGFTSPAHGSLTFVGDGTLRYAPHSGFTGADSFTYTINDGNVGTASANVSISVLNGSPAAGDDVQTRRPKLPTIVDVRDNDFDPNGDAISIVGFTQGAHGVVGMDGSGNLVYTPDPSFYGLDTFGYTIADGRGGLDSGVVFLTTPRLGDANGDDVVDGADYTLWADHYLTAGAQATFGNGDFNDDDVTDGGDYTLWADNYGSEPAEAVAVPAAAAASASTDSESGVTNRSTKLTPAAVDRVLSAREDRLAHGIHRPLRENWLGWLAVAVAQANEPAGRVAGTSPRF